METIEKSTSNDYSTDSTYKIKDVRCIKCKQEGQIVKHDLYPISYTGIVTECFKCHKLFCYDCNTIYWYAADKLSCSLCQ